MDSIHPSGALGKFVAGFNLPPAADPDDPDDQAGEVLDLLALPRPPDPAAGPDDPDDQAGRVLELLCLPRVAGRCEGGPPRLLRCEANPNRLLAIRPACGAWGCDPCAARLRLAFGSRVGRRLLGAPDTFAGVVSSKAWLSQRQALLRAASGWARVLGVGGGSVVLATAPFAGGRPVPQDAAVRALGGALGRIVAPDRARGKHFRPTSTCLAWAACSRHPPEWADVGARFNRRAADDVRGALERACERVVALDQAGGHAWAYAATVPAGEDGDRAVAELVGVLAGDEPFAFAPPF